MSRFKAGDRVKLITVERAGDIGTVVRKGDEKGERIVRFDDGSERPVHKRNLGLAEGWVPKVGDRVNWMRVRGQFDGSIVEAHDGVFDFKLRAANGDHTYAFAKELKPAPLTIQAGRHYRTRDGRKVGPIKPNVDGLAGFPWEGDEFALCWRDDGSFGLKLGVPHSTDLVAEWVEPGTAAPYIDTARIGDLASVSPDKPQRKFKVGDVVNYRLMNSAWQGVVIEEDDGRYYIGTDPKSGARGAFVEDQIELGAPTPFGAVPAPANATTPPTNFIVARLTAKGDPRPNARPRVHLSLGDAEQEAQRLADRLGDEFAVYQRVAVRDVDAGPVPKGFHGAAFNLSKARAWLSIGIEGANHMAFDWQASSQGFGFWSDQCEHFTPLGRAILRKWIAEVEAGQGAEGKATTGEVA